MAKGTVVIDPGHGGTVEIGDSSANNAVSASGVLEKNITLRLAFLVRDALKELATIGGHTLQIHLTRDTDKNLGLCDRAKVAKTKNADIFLSIHCNGFNKISRGTETLIRPAASNPKHTADKAFAGRVQKAAFNAIKSHDANAKNRGVKDQKLGVLNRGCLGPKPRGCLVEIEFIDVPAVDTLLNVGANSPQVRSDLAKAIAGAIIDDLKANP
jgi:N-acetylmuramoyl-L-alanine amidase